MKTKLRKCYEEERMITIGSIYIAKDLYDFVGHATLKDNIFWVSRVKALFQEDIVIVMMQHIRKLSRE
jgi:hypothetical protein